MNKDELLRLADIEETVSYWLWSNRAAKDEDDMEQAARTAMHRAAALRAIASEHQPVVADHA